MNNVSLFVDVSNTLNVQHLGYNHDSTRTINNVSIGDIIVVLNAAYNGPLDIVSSGGTVLGYYNFTNGNDSPIFLVRVTDTTVVLRYMAVDGGTDLWRIYRD